MDQIEQAARIEAAEVRNEMNAGAIYGLQQQAIRLGQTTRLVQIGNRVFNPAQIVIVYLGAESVSVNFAVQDGDQPLETILRGNSRLDFLAWLEEYMAASPVEKRTYKIPRGSAIVGDNAPKWSESVNQGCVGCPKWVREEKPIIAGYSHESPETLQIVLPPKSQPTGKIVSLKKRCGNV